MATTEPVAVDSFHQLGIATKLGQDDPAPWLAEVLSADVQPSFEEPGGEQQVTTARLGHTQVALLAAAGPRGPLGQYVERFGPGLHSVAWRVDDLWVAENLIRQRGIHVGDTNLAARRFFTHPKDTFGLLMAWTDRGATPAANTVAPASGPVLGVGWVTAVVRNVKEVRSFLEDLTGATVVDGLPAGPRGEEDTLDLRISDMVLRLVTPRSVSSRYATFLDRVGERLHSFAVQVTDLDAVVATGLPVLEREDTRLWTDPAATFGLRMEWVTA
ncbi:MAG: hypothetical protein JF603_07585 [Acidobacteria bacterium]|nr:hypothetical protein [Acidobacteriota bacterium]